MRGALLGELDEREVAAAVDLDQREVGARIGADHLGGVGLAVVGGDLDALGLVDHVVVGHGIAVGGDEEAGALAGREAVRGARGSSGVGSFRRPKRRKNRSIGELGGNGSSPSKPIVLAPLRILTRTEITAGFTFSTMSAKPIGRWTPWAWAVGAQSRACRLWEKARTAEQHGGAETGDAGEESETAR